MTQSLGLVEGGDDLRSGCKPLFVGKSGDPQQGCCDGYHNGQDDHLGRAQSRKHAMDNVANIEDDISNQ
jgi:hypothetical protein